MSIIKFKEYRKELLVFITGACVLGVFIAISSLPTVFWDLRPSWLNTIEVQSWREQSEPLSQSQLHILGRIITENYCPQGMIGSYAIDAMYIHLNHQEDSIVNMILTILKNDPDTWAKSSFLDLLCNVSSKHESQAVIIFRSQLLNDNHAEDRSVIIKTSIDGLFKFDPIASRDLISSFTKDSNNAISQHAIYILGEIDEQQKDSHR